jgi:DNA invertase Pin-like site-specific DNA recombinase
MMALAARTDTPMRPAIYCRVSTQEQANEGLSLTEQERRLRAYCAALGWPEPVAYVDAGQSAFNDDPGKRPAFARLLADAEAGRADTIVIANMRRWARSVLVTVHTLKRFETLGVRLISLAESVDYATPIGRMTLTILASIAQYESDDRAETARRIHAYLKAEGRWHGGYTPYGARLDADNRLALDPALAPTLARILDLAAREAPHTVAATLTAEGVPPPASRKRPDAAARGWWPQSVRRIVAGSGWLREQPAPWPARWRAAQGRPALPRVAVGKRTHMLTGLLRCRSGAAVSYGGGGPRNRGGQTVRCRGYGARAGKACPHGHTYAGVYEAQVAAALARLHDRLAATDLTRPLRADGDAAAWAALDDEKARVRHLYRRGALDPGAFDDEWSALEAREGDLAARSDDGLLVTTPILDALHRFPALPPAAQNTVARLFVARVVVAGREACVVWRPTIAAFLGD